MSGQLRVSSLFFRPRDDSSAAKNQVTIRDQGLMMKRPSLITLETTNTESNYDAESKEERPKSGIERDIPCFDFNKGNQCGNCDRAYRCVICGSPFHGCSACGTRYFCLKFALGRYLKKAENCNGRHWCLVCHENHRLESPECIRKRESLSCCLTWNSTVRML
jgi:hypothetical protein